MKSIQRIGILVLTCGLLLSTVNAAPTTLTVGKEAQRGFWGVAQSMLGANASNAEIQALAQQLMTANPGVTVLRNGDHLNSPVRATEAEAASAPLATDKADTDTLDRIRKTLQARFPKAGIQKVQPSQWPWLYEVLANDELFYVDVTGDYLFYGKILDTKNRVDLTEQRWAQLSSVNFSDLPLSLALKLVKGDGSRKLAVFADPHCPYCVSFEKTLQEVTNITVYTFMMPLESLHPGATEHAKKMWCADNRQAAWSNWMLSRSEAPTKACDASAVDTLLALGEKLRINGTPTLFFEDGRRIAGAIGKERLEDELKASSARN